MPTFPFHTHLKQQIWKIVIRNHLLTPYAEFKSCRLCHLLFHANYVLILFEYLLQIYKATVVLLPPSYMQSRIEVCKHKNNQKRIPPCMKEKTNQEHPIKSSSSDQLGLLEFLQIDFTTGMQDCTNPHTCPAMIFIAKLHFNKNLEDDLSIRVSSTPKPMIINIWLLVLSNYN